jgi:hypothetical protein
MNQAKIKNIILVAIIIAIVYLIYIRTRRPSGTQSEQMLKELYSIKDALIPKKYIEKYRSDDNNGLTIIGTAMEQIVDIMIAILKQNSTRKVIDSFVENGADATTVAEAMETVGKEIVNEINKKDVLQVKKVLEIDTIDKDGKVFKQDRNIYQLDDEPMRSGLANGAFKVLKDESKYDKYYDALKNISLAVNRKTNPGPINEQFPTKEVFKSEIMPMFIKKTESNFKPREDIREPARR